jgi:hypothetical protein
MTPSTASIEQALLDVRKAYRLLHDYQRMVMDSVDYIGKQLGLSYGGGWPKFSDPTPKAGKGGPEFWAWDWLNMVQYEFHFGRDLPTGGSLGLSMLLVSDTGYFCSDKEPVEKTNVLDFLPADRSQSKIGFVMSAKGWHPEFMQTKAGMRTFIETGGDLPPECAAAGMVARCYDLSRLITEDSTNGLIDELISVATASGISLQRVGV